jgi:hypothetical protein
VVVTQPLDTTEDQKFVSKRGKKSKVISVSNSAGSGKSAVIYVGRIPHGFYEDQMRGTGLQFPIPSGTRLIFFHVCCSGGLGDNSV